MPIHEPHFITALIAFINGPAGIWLDALNVFVVLLFWSVMLEEKSGLVRSFLARRRISRSARVRSLSLDLLLPMKVAKDAQASIDDEYAVWVEAYGFRRARWVRRVQILHIIVGHHVLNILEFAGKVLKLVSAP